MSKAKNLGGRPPKAPSDRFLTPARQLGRISDKTWTRLKAAAERDQQPFSEWALMHLLIAARRSEIQDAIKDAS